MSGENFSDPCKCGRVQQFGEGLRYYTTSDDGVCHMRAACGVPRLFWSDVEIMGSIANVTIDCSVSLAPAAVCECGVKHTGGLHSTWCPMAVAP